MTEVDRRLDSAGAGPQFCSQIGEALRSIPWQEQLAALQGLRDRQNGSSGHELNIQIEPGSRPDNFAATISGKPLTLGPSLVDRMPAGLLDDKMFQGLGVTAEQFKQQMRRAEQPAATDLIPKMKIQGNAVQLSTICETPKKLY